MAAFTGSFRGPTNAPPAPDEAEPPTNMLLVCFFD